MNELNISKRALYVFIFDFFLKATTLNLRVFFISLDSEKFELEILNRRSRVYYVFQSLLCIASIPPF